MNKRNWREKNKVDAQLCLHIDQSFTANADAMKFNGPGPERINGRLAMVGSHSLPICERQTTLLIPDMYGLPLEVCKDTTDLYPCRNLMSACNEICQRHRPS